MANDAANPARRLMELLDPYRSSLDAFVHEQPGLGAVTGLLAAIPPDVGDRIGGAWADLVRAVTDGELRRIVSHEDRLLVDLVRSLTDDRRAFAPPGADHA